MTGVCRSGLETSHTPVLVKPISYYHNLLKNRHNDATQQLQHKGPAYEHKEIQRPQDVASKKNCQKRSARDFCLNRWAAVTCVIVEGHSPVPPKVASTTKSPVKKEARWATSLEQIDCQQQFLSLRETPCQHVVMRTWATRYYNKN